MIANQKPFVTLLLLDIDGKRYGFSFSSPVSAQSYRGSDEYIQFMPSILSLSLPSRTVGVLENSITDGSVSVTLPMGACDALYQATIGATLTSGTGFVYCWNQGESLDEAFLAFRGAVRSPSFSMDKRELRFSLSIDTNRSNPSFPSAKIGDKGRFETIEDGAADSVMPIVYGRVRRMAIPVISIDGEAGTIDVCIAAHRVYGSPLSKGYVQVGNSEDGDQGGQYEVKVGVDGLGLTYSYITMGAMDFKEGLYVVDLLGKLSSSGASSVSSLGDVLYDVMVASSGFPFDLLDHKRISVAIERLNAYEIGIGINDQDGKQTLYDILTGRIQGQFPVVFGSPSGLYGWDCTAVPADTDPPFAEIVYGQNAFERVDVKQTSVTKIQNSFEMTYSFDGEAESNINSAVLNDSNSELLYDSVERFGRSAVVSVSAPDCPSSVTAGRILLDKARKESFPRTLVTYSSLSREHIDMPLMSTVLVTDDEIGWKRKRFIVLAVKPDAPSGRCGLSLMSFDGMMS